MVKPVYITEKLHEIIKLSVIDTIPNHKNITSFVEETLYNELCLIAESTNNKKLKKRLEEYDNL